LDKRRGYDKCDWDNTREETERNGLLSFSRDVLAKRKWERKGVESQGGVMEHNELSVSAV